MGGYLCGLLVKGKDLFLEVYFPVPLVSSSGMFWTQHGQLSGSSMEATAVGDLGDDVAYGCYPL